MAKKRNTSYPTDLSRAVRGYLFFRRYQARTFVSRENWRFVNFAPQHQLPPEIYSSDINAAMARLWRQRDRRQHRFWEHEAQEANWHAWRHPHRQQGVTISLLD